MLDVIEGSAMAALPQMKNVVEARPRGFGSVEEAVNWALKTRYIKSAKSAGISMPSQVAYSPEHNDGNLKFLWRTDLSKTSQFWESWFKGMDKKFLSAKCGPKVVLVADPNNLDKEMTIAQMQGKFQIQMLPSSGHAVHEDCSKEIAGKFAAYLKRFRVAEGIDGGFGRELPVGFMNSGGRNKVKAYGSEVKK